jgi:REP element-mobilizing transposase RayT
MGRDAKPPPLTSTFHDPRSTPFVPLRSRGELPHLTKPGGTYFVTFCLFDTRRRMRKRPDDRASTSPEAVGQLSEPLRDATNPLLALPRLARVVEEALLFFRSDRYLLHAWCVMPDHVHVVVTPAGDHPLGAILHSWKSYTAHQINLRVHRSGRLWQRESFDHLIRSVEDFDRFVTYVEDNPVVAGLCAAADRWPFSSARINRRSIDR